MRGQGQVQDPEQAAARLTPRTIAARIAEAEARMAPAEGETWHQYEIPAGGRVTHAAVLVPLIHRPGGLNVLLTQRTSHLQDHAGQISFPGGRVEAEDLNRDHTALREAEEEIGLPPGQVQVLGALPEYDMHSGFRITPVVGWVEPPLALKLDPFEVAEVFEVPLAFILDPANHQRREFWRGGELRRYIAMPYGGHYIWGATAGMLFGLYQVLR